MPKRIVCDRRSWILNPAAELLRYERADTVQLRQAPPGLEQIRSFIRPKKRRTRGAFQCLLANALGALCLLRD